VFSRSIYFFIVISILWFRVDVLEATNYLENVLSHGADAGGQHLFLINPATVTTEKIKAEAAVSRGIHANSLKMRRNNGQIEEQESNFTETSYGIGMISNLGSGLSLGINHQRHFQKSRSKEQGASSERVETFGGQLSSARAVIELTDVLKAGATVRYLRLDAGVLGSFDSNPSASTHYEGGLLGSGGGLHLDWNKIKAGLAYLPPLRGKAEIYGEEKILSEPGITEFTGGYQFNQWLGGFAYRRWLYKSDDRYDGTTLNDANQTSINLFGLNVDNTTIFPKSQIQLGCVYEVSPKLLVNGSIARDSVEFNFNPSVSLPGEDNGNHIYSYHRLTGGLSLNNERFQAMAGAHYQLREHEFSGNNNATIDYYSTRRYFYIGVGGRF
jgi:hypothetical protein